MIVACHAGCKTSGLKANILGLSAVWRHMLQKVADKVVFEQRASPLGDAPVSQAQCLAAEATESKAAG